MFELHEFSNYRSSDYFGQILKKVSRDVFSRCRVLYRLRKSNIYKIFLSETFVSFSVTIVLKLTEIWELEYCSYCFFKKITNRRLFHSAQSSLIYLFETFRSKVSRSKSVVNRVNLFRISIASSTSFRDSGHMGLLGILSLSLLPSPTVSTGCGWYTLTISSTDNGRDSLADTFL